MKEVLRMKIRSTFSDIGAAITKLIDLETGINIIVVMKI